jgi:hypothetical protein
VALGDDPGLTRKQLRPYAERMKQLRPPDYIRATLAALYSFASAAYQLSSSV